MTRDRYFILDGRGQPVRVGTVEEWARWSEANREARIIGKDTVSGADVSTVFLGMDHQWFDDGPPLIFETMIFGGRWDNYQWRWSTRAEAEASHAQVVEALQTGQPPLDAEEPEATTPPLRLRVGRSVGRTLYRVNEDGTEDLVGLMDTPELAAAVAAAVNGTEATSHA